MSVPIPANSFKFINEIASDSVGSVSRDIVGIRSSSSLIKVYIDGTEAASNSAANTGTVPDVKCSYGAMSLSDVSSSHFGGYREQVAFNGGAISTTDLANIRSRVTALNLSLGRS